MSLVLHFHPLSSFCQKTLIALYEADIPFTPHLVADAAEWAALKKMWPIGKFPVLRDEARDLTVPETSLIVEYLADHFPAARSLVPTDPDAARETRLADRFYDLYVNGEMQKIVSDRRRPADAKSPHMVAEARARLRVCYDVIEAQMATRVWAAGHAFTMADCAAAPALFYAHLVEPLGEGLPHLAAYYARLEGRPSVARAFAEAKPYFHMFPQA